MTSRVYDILQVLQCSTWVQYRCQCQTCTPVDWQVSQNWNQSVSEAVDDNSSKHQSTLRGQVFDTRSFPENIKQSRRLSTNL